MDIYTFKNEELKRFPLLSKITADMEVVALNNNYYEGLEGYIDEIRYGDDRETENDGILEIVVSFIPTGDLEKTHPQLNNTSVDMVIMAEELLGFKFDDSDVYLDIEGKIV